jgi:hypothetical protein
LSIREWHAPLIDPLEFFEKRLHTQEENLLYKKAAFLKSPSTFRSPLNSGISTFKSNL